MKFNSYVHNYPSKRNLVFTKKGMVGSSNPLAAQAGLEILKKGGNAIDAAIATAACLTVTEPSGNGIGGDAFVIVSFKGQLYGLNASGPAGALADAQKLRDQGYESIPLHGLDPVTVPGIPKAWAELNKKFGKLTLLECLQPAINHANEGYAITPTVARLLKRYVKVYGASLEKFPSTQTWFDTFVKNGKVLEVGEILTLKDHAKSLQLIGETNADAFYTGEIADAIEKFMIKYDGVLRKKDLADYQVEWVKPLSTNYRGYDIWQLPPNSQGIVVLEALNILENFNLTHKEDILTYHRQIEAIKLAFVDGIKYIADPKYAKADVDMLISKEYAKKRFDTISDQKAQITVADDAPGGGTVYLACADDEGNMVSYIQSCYTGFGCGSVVDGYGICLHNRGAQFTLEKGHHNELVPFKRPYHTIIPGFITKDGKDIGPYGIMGGPLQPQAHLQALSSMIDFNLNPQDALDAPRWQWLRGNTIEVEPDFPSHIALGLLQLGHEIVYANESIMYGRGQIILKRDDGTLVGATESRADGTLAIW